MQSKNITNRITISINIDVESSFADLEIHCNKTSHQILKLHLLVGYLKH